MSTQGGPGARENGALFPGGELGVQCRGFRALIGAASKSRACCASRAAVKLPGRGPLWILNAVSLSFVLFPVRPVLSARWT